jgi:hypothetical protein
MVGDSPADDIVYLLGSGTSRTMARYPCITKAPNAYTKANGGFIRLRKHAAQPYDASSASLPTT